MSRFRCDRAKIERLFGEFEADQQSQDSFLVSSKHVGKESGSCDSAVAPVPAAKGFRVENKIQRFGPTCGSGHHKRVFLNF